MKRKRRICIFVVVLILAAVQGTIWAVEQDTEILEEAATETTEAAKKDVPRQIMQKKETVKKSADGQTLLNVNQGNITIASTGATGGGV